MRAMRWVVVAVFALSISLWPTALLAGEQDGHEDLALQALPTEQQAAYAANWQQPLGPVFVQASTDYKVPYSILLTLGQVGSAFENRGGAPTIERGYGIMALRENGNAGGDSLALAAQLIGLSVEQLKLDPVANIIGGAAVLDEYARQLDVDRKADLTAWADVLVRYAALDTESSREFAAQVYEKIERGFTVTNNQGETFTLEGASLGIAVNDLLQLPDQVASTDYGPAVWDPTSCNYNAGYWSKDTVVVHTIEGSASGARSWMKNCSSNVSAHYVISESGGVWQLVREDDLAWTQSCYNSRSVGLEHEGYAASSSHPQALYDASGLLTRDICNDWGIPKSKRTTGPGIIGHVDVTRCCCGTHTDPGNGWNWTYYISVVTGAPPTPSWDADYKAQSFPSSMVAGSTAIAWAEFYNRGTQAWHHCETKLGTSSPQDRSSPFCNLPNWSCADLSNQSCARPTDVDQSEVTTNNVGRFTFILKAPSTPGTYTEKFKLLRAGVTWFGPEISWKITVTAATGNLTGTITNASNSAAISGATVTLTGVSSTTTNTSGVYTFNNVTAGTYSMTVSKTGFNNGTTSVTISAGATATKNMALTPTDTQAPTTPTNLNGSAVDHDTVSLTWTASTDNVGVTGYEIRRDSVTIGTSTTTSYTDNTATPNSTMSYQVRAKDAVPNYSAWSTAKSITTPEAPPSSTVVFSDGFNGNLNNWTQQVGGYAYSTTVNHAGLTGAGAAFMAAGESDQMYRTFTRPFAQAKFKAYFYDGKGGWKPSVCGWSYRQAMSLRDTGGAAKVYIDNEFYNSPDNAKYYYRLVGAGSGGAHTTYATRDPDTDCTGAWIMFETTVTPGAPGASPTGTFTAKVTDGAGATSTTQNLTTDFFDWGIGRITLGLGISSTNEGYWDDVTFEATPPGKPTMNTPTVLSSTSIRWNFTRNNNNHFGWDVATSAGTIVSPSYPAAGWLGHNVQSWTETGLTPNTAYTRKVRGWNGTLNGSYSATVTAQTLSPAPGVSSITTGTPNTCPGSDVVWTAVGGFGAGKVQDYLYAWDQDPTHTFTGNEALWDSGLLVTTPTSTGTWYLHVQGRNADGIVNGSYSYSVLTDACAPPTLVAAVSRKTHGGAGDFDLDVTGTTAVENRADGPTKVVVTFNEAVEGLDGLDVSDVSVSDGDITDVLITGSVLTVTLEAVVDGDRLIMSFPGIVGLGGIVGSAGTLCFGSLVGDTTGDGVTNVFDLVLVRNNLNASASASNFRSDVNNDGTINVFDLVMVRNNLNDAILDSCP